MLAKSQRTLEQYPDSVDAVCTYWDFPTSTLVPILRERFGLTGADLSAVLKLEHKYWARREQQAVVPELIPDFCAVDPFADDPAESLSIDYPLWLKPIKAHSSYLGFRIHNDREWRHAIEQTRRGIEQFAKPFNEILAFADLPAAIAPIGGYHCIAEGIISAGQQCTLEGYAYQGEVVVYGVVDSVRGGRHRSSFQRYQYPSALPRRVQSRMIDAARRVIRHAGYTDAPFNMEFFWHRSRDTLSLLEVNARCSKSHSPLFHLG
jgi:Biotin carboxylase